ncbi:hypothetical protein BJF86_02500 [Serinicoccus sp. CNJ-927]|nr:hypothetical protein BJF86_02500 [Serinicoccus sp. CNJ-927]
MIPGLVVAAYCKLRGVPFVLDSHPGSFGDKHNDVSRRLIGVTRFLARRAAAVMVTVDDYAAQVQSWGGRGIVAHEAPPGWSLPHKMVGERFAVLFICVFAPDEPVAAVWEAARRLPQVDFLVTGQRERCPEQLRRSAPSNVTLVGFLDQARYVQQIGEVHAVLSLTTAPTSVMRSAYEAVYGLRGLVTSDWPALRRYFPSAEHAQNGGAEIAAAVSRLEERLRRPGAAAQLTRARAVQLERWKAQLTQVRTALSHEPAGLPV